MNNFKITLLILSFLGSYSYALEKPDVCLAGQFYIHEATKIMVPTLQDPIPDEEWVSINEGKPNIYFIRSEKALSSEKLVEERVDNADHNVVIRKDKKSPINEPVQSPPAILIKKSLFLKLKTAFGSPIPGKDSCDITSDTTRCRFNNENYSFKEVIDKKDKKWHFELTYKTVNQKFNYDNCTDNIQPGVEGVLHCGEYPVNSMGIRLIWAGDLNSDGLLDFILRYNSSPWNYYYRLVFSEKTSTKDTRKDPKWVETYQCYNSQE